MGRVDEFKALRKHRYKCLLVILLFSFLCISGVVIADLSVNSLMAGEDRIRMVEWTDHPDRTVTVHLLNEEVELRMDKLYDDLDAVKKKVLSFIGK